MKNLSFYFTSFLLMIALGISLNSCTDPCKDTECLNGGTCNDGNCDCPEGYTGSICETQTDPCAGVTCQNGGVCVNGDCDCPPGYTGDDCSGESNDVTPFLGTYDADQTCTTSNTTYIIVITEGTDTAEVVMSNFAGLSILISGFITGNDMSIPSQTDSGLTITGSGSLSGSILTITYTITDGTNSDSCTVTATRQ